MNGFSDDEEVVTSLGTSSDMPLNSNKKEEPQKAAEETPESKKTRKRPTFDERNLIRPNHGLPRLIASTQATMKWGGRGHEASDVKKLLSNYRTWAYDLAPWLAFEDFTSRCDNLRGKLALVSTIDAMHQDERDRWLEQKFPDASNQFKKHRTAGPADDDDDGVVYDEVGASSSSSSSSSSSAVASAPSVPPKDPEALKEFLALKRAEALAKLALKKNVAQEEARLKAEAAAAAAGAQGGGKDLVQEDEEEEDPELSMYAGGGSGQQYDDNDDELENELLDDEFALASPVKVKARKETLSTVPEGPNEEGMAFEEEETQAQKVPVDAVAAAAAAAAPLSPGFDAEFDRILEATADNDDDDSAVVESGQAPSSQTPSKVQNDNEESPEPETELQDAR